MKDISFELEILSHYYDSEIVVDHMTMVPVYEFVHKTTGKKYVYRIDTEKEVLALRCETTFVRINEYGEAIKISDNVRAKYPERSIRIEKESN